MSNLRRTCLLNRASRHAFFKHAARPVEKRLHVKRFARGHGRGDVRALIMRCKVGKPATETTQPRPTSALSAVTSLQLAVAQALGTR